jgi:cell wall-associated NlpC family hydrolase
LFANARVATLAALMVTLIVATVPGTAAAAVDEREKVASFALSAVGSKFRIGSEGPRTFDCSGLVWWSFNSAGLGDRIGSKRMRAREYQRWFRARGLLITRNPQVGDLVFYANPARHTGIVTSIDKRGRARVTSALTSGVATTRYNSLNVPVHSFGRVSLGVIPDPDPTPTPTPSPTPSASPSASPVTSPMPTAMPTATPAT